MNNIDKNKFKSNVMISGIAFSLGSLTIKSEEKARIVVGEKDLKNETDKIVKGLGINRTSIAAHGEDVITNASLALLKLLVLYNINPKEISNLVIATETPHDISQSIANPVVRLTNNLISLLNKNGYNISHLEPDVMVHMQSACTSAGSALSNYTLNGLKGKAIIVATDNAEYKLGSSADETGGFGSVAMLVEPYSDNKKGIILSDKVGHYADEVPDFIKLIFDDEDSSSGLSLVARYPVVFGKFSEEVYSLAIFKALKSLSKKSDIPINNIDMLKEYDLVSHLPFPKLPDKLLAYLIRHMAREDPNFNRLLEKQLSELGEKNRVSISETFIPGFKNLEEEFDFIVKFESLYDNSIGIYKEINSRMGETHRSNKIELKKDKIKSIITGVDNLISDFSYNPKIVSELKETESKLKELEKNGIDLNDESDNINKAFKNITDMIDKFENENNAYSKSIRSTELFKSIRNELHIEGAIKLSKEIGNIYTGSLLIGLISYLTNVDKLDKNLLLAFYGSGSESYVLRAKPNMDKEFLDKLKLNIDNEFNKQVPITADDYLKMRRGMQTDIVKLPVVRNNIMREESIDDKVLLNQINKYNTYKIKNMKIRSADKN